MRGIAPSAIIHWGLGHEVDARQSDAKGLQRGTPDALSAAQHRSGKIARKRIRHTVQFQRHG